jgi:thymidylate kinase
MSGSRATERTALLREVLTHLEAEGVRYCLLHRWAGFPALGDTDADVVVDHEDLGRVHDLLIRGGGPTELNVVQCLRHESTAYYYVLEAIAPGAKPLFLKLDVCSTYRRDGRVLFEPREFLGSRRQSEGLWLPPPDVEFTCYLLKRAGKGSISEDGLRILVEAYEQERVQSMRTLAHFVSEPAVEAAREAFDSPDLEDVAKLLPRLHSDSLKTVRTQRPLSVLRYLAPELSRRVQRWTRYSGLFVVVLGPDGSGKSLVVDGLTHELTAAFRGVETRHLRPGILRRRGPADGGPTLDPHGLPAYGSLVSIAKLLYVLADYVLGYPLCIRPLLVRSNLVIYDRYYYDLLVDPLRFRYGGPRSLPRLLSSLVKSPDVILILESSPDTLQARKAEVTPRESSRQSTEYRALSERMPNAILIDADAAPEDVVSGAAAACSEVLKERYA